MKRWPIALLVVLLSWSLQGLAALGVVEDPTVGEPGWTCPCLNEVGEGRVDGADSGALAEAGGQLVVEPLAEAPAGQGAATLEVTVTQTPSLLATFFVSALNAKTGEPMAFDASASGGGEPLSLYEWDFDGDGNVDIAQTSSATTHAYAVAGLYAPTLRVTDAMGRRAEAAFVTVRVTNRPPVAAFALPIAEARVGEATRFADASTDTDGSIVAWLWSFGDGSESTEQHPEHVYAAAGTYAVNLSVADEHGGTAAAETQDVVVERAPLVAAFRVSGEAVAGVPVVFIVAAPADAESTIVHVGWDFGDGVVATGGAVADATYTHVFATPGVFAVRLYIVDDRGTLRWVEQTVDVAGGSLRDGL